MADELLKGRDYCRGLGTAGVMWLLLTAVGMPSVPASLTASIAALLVVCWSVGRRLRQEDEARQSHETEASAAHDALEAKYEAQRRKDEYERLDDGPGT